MIKNLPRQLNPGGYIKIGKKGKMITSVKGNEFRPPKKLDHFQLVTTQRDQNDDYIVDVDLQNKIKESGTGLVNENGCLVGIPIRLLYNDTDLNFPHRYVSYVSGKLSCHGDGEHSTKRVDDFQKTHPCPCSRLDQNYNGNDKCKISGSLICIIDEAGLFGQAHKFTTTSVNTVKGILGGIELIKMSAGGKIAGLPLMLTMNEKTTTTPQGINTVIHIVSICYRGSMTDLRDEVLRIMSMEKQFLISMDTIEAEAKEGMSDCVVDEEDENDFVEEFFPDAVVVSSGNADKKEVEVETVENETVDKEEPEDVEDFKIEKEKKIDAPELSGMLEPIGPYKIIYDNLLEEKVFDKAISLVKRLQKGNIIYYLVNNYQDVDFPESSKKPDLVEIVENVLKTVLGESDQETVEPEEVEPEEKQVEKEPEQKEFKKPPREWDTGGPIVRDQMLKIVALKTALEKYGILNPLKWTQHVNYFLDAEGNEINKAVELSRKQGDGFIAMLKHNLPEDHIPF